MIMIYISDKRKVEAAEMRFLRPLAGYILWNKKISCDIREQFGIFNINDKLMQYKINWREHIQRIDDNRLAKKKLMGDCKPYPHNVKLVNFRNIFLRNY